MIPAETQQKARRDLFYAQVGRELRRFREAAGLSQGAIGEALGHTRDWTSKVERGDIPIDLFSYTRLMAFHQELAPDHPAVALAGRLLPGIARLKIEDGD